MDEEAAALVGDLFSDKPRVVQSSTSCAVQLAD